MNELFPNAIYNTIDEYIIITFSILNNPYQCHPYIFITENYFSKFTIMSFWAPALNPLAENGIPKKISRCTTAFINGFFNCCGYRIIATCKNILQVAAGYWVWPWELKPRDIQEKSCIKVLWQMYSQYYST